MWRFSKALDFDIRKHCGACVGVVEDVNHALWGCLRAQCVWSWIEYLVALVDRDHSNHVTISIIVQALIVKLLACSPSKQWWAMIRVITIWFIWVARNSESIPKRKIATNATKAKIWHQVKQHLCIEWEKLREKVQSGHLIEHQAQINFEFDFGNNDRIFSLNGEVMSFNLLPPELD